ncbi:MAG TPA: hypothetical protein VIL24_04275 [Clostridia bacterium]
MRKRVIILVLVLAVVLINSNFTVFGAPTDSQKSIDRLNGQELEVYDGKVYHIFFHSLIINPKQAFSSNMKNGYNNWMTTREEFKKILDKLYENNFILININDLITCRNGQLVKNKLALPKGKKPLIISFDDINYYEYMKGCGFADRLTVKDGRVTTIVKTGSGEVVDWEGDAIPILDSFVEKHPDFSFKGSKGIVAVTGYQGVFGYRLKNEQEKGQAKLVAETLRKTGWLIANHSYSHSSMFKKGISLGDFKRDLDKWEKFIAPIVGKTNIYISPFGVSFNPKDAKMNYLKSKGYNIFCPVYKEMSIKIQNNILISERLNIDGLTMKKFPNRIKKYFFDPAGVVDPARPRIRL